MHSLVNDRHHLKCSMISVMCLVVCGGDFSDQVCQEARVPRDAKKRVHELGSFILFHAVPPMTLGLSNMQRGV
jgi:hypothetical protein